jgi:hypothetical protein
MDGQDELREVIEKAREPFERVVGATMAVTAALLAVVAVYGHITTTEELLLQQRASDQWSYYQSKAIRRYQSEASRDLLSLAAASAARDEILRKYSDNLKRYDEETKEIEAKARDLEAESAASGRHALRLHIGEIFLEIAIVFSSLALLLRRRAFWLTAVGSAALGAVVAATALFIG